MRILSVRGFTAIYTGRWIGRGGQHNGLREVSILLYVAFPCNCAKEEVYRSKPNTRDKLEQQNRDTFTALPLDLRKSVAYVFSRLQNRAKFW